MDEKIVKFNVELAELLNTRFGNLLDGFNLGVEVGRYLENQKIDNFVLPAVIEHNNAIKKAEIITSLNKRIENSLKTLLANCFGDYISKNDRAFQIEKRNYNYDRCDKWDDAIAYKYGITYVNADMEQYGGEFRLKLTACGWLKELNAKYKLPLEFTADYSNSSGEEYEMIYSKEDAEGSIWGLRTHYNYAFQTLTIAEIESYVDELEKHITFILLSSS